jgi:Questin oxidase-like
VPPSFFAKLPDFGLLSGLTSKLSILRVSAPAFEEKRPTFAFLRRIRDHHKFKRSTFSPDPSQSTPYTAVVRNVGDTIVALVNEWVDQWLEGTHNDDDVEKRLEGMVEEVAWGHVIWFGVGGWQTRGNSDRPLNADFFMYVQLSVRLYILLIRNSAHFVTSAVFLFTLVLPDEHLPYPPAPLASRLTLLKAYLATCAGWYIGRGITPLPIKEFYSATQDRLTAPPATPAPALSLAQASQRSRWSVGTYRRKRRCASR